MRIGREVIGAVGFAVIVYGVQMIYPPAAWLVAGVVLVCYGVTWGMGSNR